MVELLDVWSVTGEATPTHPDQTMSVSYTHRNTSVTQSACSSVATTAPALRRVLHKPPLTLACREEAIERPDGCRVIIRLCRERIDLLLAPEVGRRETALS